MVWKVPIMISGTASVWKANAMPNAAIPMHDRHTCHFRSIRSANSVLTSGNSG